MGLTEEGKIIFVESMRKKFVNKAAIDRYGTKFLCLAVSMDEKM